VLNDCLTNDVRRNGTHSSGTDPVNVNVNVNLYSASSHSASNALNAPHTAETSASLIGN